MADERKECIYPMNEFYNFEDEVPYGSRVSTSKDCKECEEISCDLRYCLIEELSIPHPCPDE